MTYLWLSRWPPYAPLRGGDMDYARDLLHSLAALRPVRGLAAEAPGVTPPEAGPVSWTVLSHMEPSRLRSLFSPLPNVAFRHRSAAYLREAAAMARDAEAVFIDFIGMAWIVRPLRRLLREQGLSVPVIMVTHNHEHAVRLQMTRAERHSLMRAALAFDTAKAGRLERAANAAADGLTTITEADRQAFARQCATASITIAPAYSGPVTPARTLTEATPRRVCILGNHAAHHKRLVLERTLEALAAVGAERAVPIDVVGDGDNAEFERRFPGFNYLGYVEDVQGYLAGVRLGLVPDEIGGGFKYRALMHAFLRTPMLAVRQAMAGMGFAEGIHFEGVEDVAALAAAIPALIDDTLRLDRLQQAAFKHCRSHYDWDERGRTLHVFAQDLRKSSGG